ncbi:zinc-dependent alcohol dehydrogenase [Brevibacterium sp. GP-SGM9]|uniref:zinc-dependent alcohol dehydrogenase n=1 Tax=Brevibacterium sp. GP-SGM9 TaxID=3376990 RepID=UPI0039A6E97D
MRSAEITAPGRVEIVGRPRPQGRLGAGEVRVRMLAVGICGTDLALLSGRRTPPEHPWRLGHEGIGEIAEVGPGTVGLTVGDRVALEPNITCGDCEHCRRGTTSACLVRRSAGVLTQPGFLAEVIDHPSEFCHRIDPAVPLERAVCAEPLAVTAAAIRRSQVRVGAEVLVIGAGAQGLLSISILIAQGHRPFVSEPDRRRRELAVDLGARVFEPGLSPAPEFVIDAAGVPEALGSVVHHLAPFASVTLVGEDHHHLGASSFDIVQKQLRIAGSFIYEHPQDMAAAVNLLAEVRAERILAPATALEDLPGLLGGQDAARDGSAPAAPAGPAGRAGPAGIKQWVDLRR